MRLWLIKKLGGYTDVKSALEAAEKQEDKFLIITKAVEKLFNTVSANDLLRKENGEWMFGKQMMTNTEYQVLTEQVRHFVKSFLFKVLEAEVKYHCNQLMRKATTIEALTEAKIIEYVFDVLKTRLKQF